MYYKRTVTLMVIVIGCLTLLTFSRSNQMTTLRLRSPAFKNDEAIPRDYTCTGRNISPQLEWQKLDGVKGYMLIVDDPDAQRVAGKTFVHWILSLPISVTHLGEASSYEGHASPVGTEYENDFNNTYYGGPCPPKDSGMHNYHFTLFALSIAEEELKDNPTIKKGHLTADQFRKVFKDKIIAEDYIIGKFGVE